MNLSRRHFLTTTSAGVLSPLMGSILHGIEARASGRTDHPLRFVFFIKSNGLWAEHIQPPDLLDRLPFDPSIDVSKGKEAAQRRKRPTPAANLRMEDAYALSPTMKPLEPFRDRISIIQGIQAGFNVYHSGQYQTLGGFQGRVRNSRETLGPTVDALLARAFPCPVPHLCLGHDSKAPSGVSYIPTSCEGVGKPIPFYTKPARAYKELFGVVAHGNARDEYNTQSDILDFFVADSKRLQAAVAGPEREQLDRYINAFESVRRSRKEIEGMSEVLRKRAPEHPGEVNTDHPGAIAAANTDIAIAALTSGLTQVVTLRFDLLGSSSYQGIGGLHGGVGHGQVKDVPGARRQICGIHFEQIARMASALEAIPEGDGTMLDNTVMVYTSDNGETHHSSGVNYPLMVLGDLGGRLARRRYYAPGNDPADKSAHVRLGDVWATLLGAAGQPYEQFGIPVNGHAYRPIDALLS